MEQNLFETRALILRANDFSDNDRYLQLLTKEGMLDCFAKGARRKNSNLQALTESFSFCNCTIFTNKERYYLNKADLIFPFSKLKASIEKLTVAAHLAELAMDLAQSLDELDYIYNTMLYAYYALERTDERVDELYIAKLLDLAHLAELNLLYNSGFALQYNIENTQEEYVFDFQESCFLSSKDIARLKVEGSYIANIKTWSNMSGDQYKPQNLKDFSAYKGYRYATLSAELFFLLRSIFQSPVEKLFNIILPKKYHATIASFSNLYILACLGRQYTKLDYIQALGRDFK